MITTSVAVEVFTAAATHPVVAWVGIVGVSILVLSTVFKRSFGPVSQTIAAWGETRRRSAASADESRFTDMSANLEHMSNRVDALSSRLQRIEDYDQEHVGWDWNSYHRLKEIAGSWPKPPSMYARERVGDVPAPRSRPDQEA